jgi:histidinol dehydrogenase
VYCFFSFIIYIHHAATTLVTPKRELSEKVKENIQKNLSKIEKLELEKEELKI